MALDVTPEYAKSLGRIGGQLLSSNLELQGNDLQFDTDLLYLDVANNRIAINNYGASPFDLYIGSAASDQKILSTNLIVDGVTTTNNGWTIQTNNIQPPATGTLYVRPVQLTDPIIYTNGVGDDKINIFDRLIVAKNLNENINLSPNGTGITNVTGDLTIQGTSGLVYVTGNVLVDGNYFAGSQINFGDQTGDLLDFNADVNADLVPSIANTYELGPTEKWGALYAYNLTASDVNGTIGIFGGIAIRASSIFSADNSKDIRIYTPDNLGSTTLTPITVGPATTLFSLTSNSVNLSKDFYSQVLVDSLIGQTAVIDRYPLQPLFYTVVAIEDEPTSPTTQWKMTVNTTFDPTGQLKPISFYPDAGSIDLVTNDIWDTTGNSIGEKWVAWYKTNLPVNFETTVQPSWTINVAGTLYIVDYVIQDPINTNMWRIYVTTSLVAGVGIPIFSPPTIIPTTPGGKVLFNGLEPFNQNNINNNTLTTYNPPYYLQSTADGYIRFAGTNGIVIPAGTEAQRETELLGTTRYNTDTGYLEIFNGTNWQNAIGAVALATQQDIEDNSVIYDLMLG